VRQSLSGLIDNFDITVDKPAEARALENPMLDIRTGNSPPVAAIDGNWKVGHNIKWYDLSEPSRAEKEQDIEACYRILSLVQLASRLGKTKSEFGKVPANFITPYICPALRHKATWTFSKRKQTREILAKELKGYQTEWLRLRDSEQKDNIIAKMTTQDIVELPKLGRPQYVELCKLLKIPSELYVDLNRSELGVLLHMCSTDGPCLSKILSRTPGFTGGFISMVTENLTPIGIFPLVFSETIADTIKMICSLIHIPNVIWGRTTLNCLAACHFLCVCALPPCVP
jgi:hypothetical protein